MKSGKMNIWRNYLLLDTKKGMKFIPFFAFSLALIAGAIVLAASVFLAFAASRGSLTRAQIGIVTTDIPVTVSSGDGTDSDGSASESSASSAESDSSSDDRSSDKTKAPKDATPGTMTSLAVRLVSQMDSVKELASFSFVKQKAADKGLRDGSLDAVIYISTDTYDNINKGTNTPVLIRLGAGASGLQKDLFASLVSAGVRIIRTVEGAVYAPMIAGNTYTLVTDAGTIGDRIFDIFLKTTMNRSALWNTVSVSAFGTLTGSAFYLVSAVTAALFLYGIGFASFYTKEERTVLRVLSRSGPSVTIWRAARFLAVFFSCTVFGVLLVIIARLATGPAQEKTAGAVLASFPASLPFILSAAVLLASWIQFIYTFLPDQTASYGMLLLDLLLFAVSGGLFPTVSLPFVVRSVSVFSPVHLEQVLMSHVIWPDVSIETTGALLASAALTVLFLALSRIGGNAHD